MKNYLDCKERYPCDVKNAAAALGAALVQGAFPISCLATDSVSKGKKRITIWKLLIDDEGKDPNGAQVWYFNTSVPGYETCRGEVRNAKTGHVVGNYTVMRVELDTAEDCRVIDIFQK